MDTIKGKNNLVGPIVFAVSGIKNAGKTTVISYLVKELTSLGYKVGVIKHDGHDFVADHEGTDSYRHKAAGASNVIIYSKTKIMMVADAPQEESEEKMLEQLLDLQAGMDVVILEGMKYSAFPKIEIVRSAVGTQPVCDLDTVFALVSDCNLRIEGIPIIPLADKEAIKACVLRYIAHKGGSDARSSQ